MGNEQNNSNSVIHTLVSNLSNLNIQLRSMGESLKKLENNEIESFKNNYEFKYSVIGEIKNLGNEINNVQNIFKDMTARMDIKQDDVDKKLEEIKDCIEDIPTTPHTDDNKSYKLLAEEKERWIKRLWPVVVTLVLAILALLGMNLFGVIKLPGIGG